MRPRFERLLILAGALLVAAAVASRSIEIANEPSNLQAPGGDGPPCEAQSDFRAVDLSTPITEVRDLSDDRDRPALTALKEFGVQTIIRYYDWDSENLACKTLLKEETDEILKNFSILVVFQHYSGDPETFFDEARGEFDAKRALALAKADLLPNIPSLIRRVCSGYAPDRGVLRTRLV